MAYDENTETAYRDQTGALSVRKMLHLMVERSASDLHIKVGSPPGLRVNGTIRPLGTERLRPGDTTRLVRELLSGEQLEKFEREGDLDMAYSLDGVSRYRVNVLRQRGSMGMAIRRIPETVPTIDELNLPGMCKVLALKPRGLVLITGPTGSGKSTTLAAMVDHVNSQRACHILTMEDPIEYIHRDKKSYVTQREIGRDTASFNSALRRALRQDPDVIMVGEMRDLETISLAVTAAETGHLVSATLHTTSAIQTIDRIVDVFPVNQQQQIRIQLADALQGVLSQTMLPKIGGGCVVAHEILVGVDSVRACIREAKTPQLGNVMQTGAKVGMRTLETALNELVARNVILYNTALIKANHPKLILRTGQIAKAMPIHAR